jgi:hypothetical protein
MKKSTIITLLLLLIPLIGTSIAAEATLFDEIFVRNTVAPFAALRTFRAVSGPATVNFISTGISSASVSINDVEVFGPSEFNQKVGNIEKFVTLSEGQNSLTVILRGGIGGTVRIQIHMPVEIMLAPSARHLKIL